MKPPILKTVRVRNFKAIRDTGTFKLGPLTVLIGNNGSGKSSLIEALETYQEIVTHDLDTAMQRWLGFAHIWNRRSRHQLSTTKRGGTQSYENPMTFEFRGRAAGKRFLAQLSVNADPGENAMRIEHERFVATTGLECERDAAGKVAIHEKGSRPRTSKRGLGESVVFGDGREFVAGWQFLRLNPEQMGKPTPQLLTGPTAKLHPDGSNVAQYVWQIRTRDLSAFEGMIEALKYVLPYSSDVQPAITQEIQRTVYLQLTESDFKVPGWLLSTGTLRVLALLAVLRNPDPAPLLVIEEIENGLDPRTIHLLVDELQRVVRTGRTQIILTTHSPYMLDLFPLSSIVLADRVDKEPRFTRPADEKGVRKWAKQFAPGKLYTMGRLNRDQSEKSE